MKIRAVEEETRHNTYQVDVECTNCGYTRLLTLARGKLLVRTACPQCDCDTLRKKGTPTSTIHHQKDL